MLDVLEIGRGSTIADVEQSLGRLADASPACDLLLPTSLRARQLGGTPAFLQLLATWRRRCPAGRLRIHVQPGVSAASSEAMLASFLDTDHGLFAFALADQVHDRVGERELGPAALQLADARLRAMDDVRTAQHGPKALLMCVDETLRAAPRTLYQPPGEGEPELRSVEGFVRLATALREAASSERSGVPTDEDRSMSLLLRELVRNTHQWARSDPHGARYRRSVRGLRFELHNIGPERERALIADQAPLRDYLGRLPRTRRGRLHLVELAVFDCGPGLAARRLAELGKDARTADDEYPAIRDCLRKHFSTSAEPTKGAGLHHVLGTLSDIGGFLRVRTGRVNLYRYFSELPYDPKYDRDEPYLQDWHARLGLMPAVPVAGTFYTLVYPRAHGQEAAV